MITATCRTCHQDWTIDETTPPFWLNEATAWVFPAPCGHGRFMGHVEISSSLEEQPVLASPLVRWEWQEEAEKLVEGLLVEGEE